MIPGMNPRQMQQAMKKMGIKQETLPAHEVIIRLGDTELVISNPEVTRINMMGQMTFQIAGAVEERETESAPSITDEDIQTVIDQTGVTQEVAKQAIADANGDLAEAILALSEDE
jgi:nascent polypeptide-associated complex subunit alpha